MEVGHEIQGLRIEDVEETEWLSELNEMFGDTNPETLARACRDILKTRKTPFFPLPAEIEEAITQAKQNLDRDASKAGFAKQMEEMAEADRLREEPKGLPYTIGTQEIPSTGWKR
jgi:ubiquinone biosynthesis protein UbiJ